MAFQPFSILPCCKCFCNIVAKEVFQGFNGHFCKTTFIGKLYREDNLCWIPEVLQKFPPELGLSISVNHTGEPKILEPLMGLVHDTVSRQVTQLMYPWKSGVAVNHHQVVSISVCKKVDCHLFHRIWRFFLLSSAWLGQNIWQSSHLCIKFEISLHIPGQ